MGFVPNSPRNRCVGCSISEQLERQRQQEAEGRAFRQSAAEALKQATSMVRERCVCVTSFIGLLAVLIQMAEMVKVQTKPAITSQYRDLQEFMQQPKLAAADFTSKLQDQGIVLWQLPSLTVENLQSCGLALGVAHRVATVASRYSPD